MLNFAMHLVIVNSTQQKLPAIASTNNRHKLAVFDTLSSRDPLCLDCIEDYS